MPRVEPEIPEEVAEPLASDRMPTLPFKPMARFPPMAVMAFTLVTDREQAVRAAPSEWRLPTSQILAKSPLREEMPWAALLQAEREVVVE